MTKEKRTSIIIYILTLILCNVVFKTIVVKNDLNNVAIILYRPAKDSTCKLLLLFSNEKLA